MSTLVLQQPPGVSQTVSESASQSFCEEMTSQLRAMVPLSISDYLRNLHMSEEHITRSILSVIAHSRPPPRPATHDVLIICR